MNFKASLKIINYILALKKTSKLNYVYKLTATLYIVVPLSITKHFNYPAHQSSSAYNQTNVSLISERRDKKVSQKNLSLIFITVFGSPNKV